MALASFGRWILAVVSVLSQRARHFRLPLYLQVPLLPLLGVEALLRRLANRITAEGFPVKLSAPRSEHRRPQRSWQR